MTILELLDFYEHNLWSVQRDSILFSLEYLSFHILLELNIFLLPKICVPFLSWSWSEIFAPWQPHIFLVGYSSNESHAKFLSFKNNVVNLPACVFYIFLFANTPWLSKKYKLQFFQVFLTSSNLSKVQVASNYWKCTRSDIYFLINQKYSMWGMFSLFIGSMYVCQRPCHVVNHAFFNERTCQRVCMALNEIFWWHLVVSMLSWPRKYKILLLMF